MDIDDFTARLQGVAADRQAPRQSHSPAASLTPPYDEEEYYRYHLKEQTEYYNTLVNEGGRPSHPVHLGQGILKHPGEYREILSYWQHGDSHDWKVFESQMGNWRHFRRWQHKNRKGGRFHKYVEGVKQGLAEHGVMRPFNMEEDPERQDKLTTWIEYLDFEYWWYDKDMRFVKRHQARYDEAWKKLVESRVLRPFETEEVICDIASAFQRAGEEDRAEKAVASAKSAVMLIQKSKSELLSQPRETLSAAQSTLAMAMKSLESIRRSNDLVGEFKQKTKNYLIAKCNAEGRLKLLRWILQQLALVELEMTSVKVVENSPNTSSDAKPRLKRSRVDEVSEGRFSKRLRNVGDISDHKAPAPAPAGESQIRRSSQDSAYQGPVSKRPRYNAQNRNICLEGTANPAVIEERLSIHSLVPCAENIPAARSAMQGETSDDLPPSKSRALRRSTRLRKRPERFQ